MQGCFASIIIPVYNAGVYLKPCLDSVLRQTCADWELLLIDDGSNDGSEALCDAYASSDMRIRVFHQIQSGVSRARNIGLVQARGEWIMFVDADDIVHSDLVKCVQRAASGEGSGADILCWEYEIFDESPKLAAVPTLHICSKSIEILLREIVEDKEAGYVWNKAFRRAYLSQKYFCEDIRIQEDQLFVVECLCGQSLQGSIAQIDAVLYGYRQHPHSVCRHSFSESHITILLAKERILKAISAVRTCEKWIELLRISLAQLICIYNKKMLLHQELRRKTASLMDRLWREYSIGYERGNWPVKLRLYAMLMDWTCRIRARRSRA